MIDPTSVRSTPALVTLGVAAVLTACAARHETKAVGATVPPPQILTVPKIKGMLDEGTQPEVIFGAMDSSGTVYRLTTEQRANLARPGCRRRCSGGWVFTYEHALQKNPALAKSDDKWKQIDGYWYGGLPLGWPREWVVGAPAPGELLR